MMLDHRERERIRRYHFSLPSVSVRYVSRQFTFEFHFSSYDSLSYEKMAFIYFPMLQKQSQHYINNAIDTLWLGLILMKSGIDVRTYVTQHHQMRHKSRIKVLSKLQIKEE